MAFCWREPDANIYTAGIRMQPIFIGPLFAAQLANAGSTGESGRSRRNSYSGGCEDRQIIDARHHRSRRRD
jgi:hypothetical protein